MMNHQFKNLFKKQYVIETVLEEEAKPVKAKPKAKTKAKLKIKITKEPVEPIKEEVVKEPEVEEKPKRNNIKRISQLPRLQSFDDSPHTKTYS